MKLDNTFLIATGVIAFVVVGHYLSRKKERTYNASGTNTQKCPSNVSGTMCANRCMSIGGVYDGASRTCDIPAYGSFPIIKQRMSK
jgi:hypothetical protein